VPSWVTVTGPSDQLAQGSAQVVDAPSGGRSNGQSDGPSSAPASAQSVADGQSVTDGQSVERQLVVVFSLVYALLAAGLSMTAALPELRRSVPMSDVVTSLHGSFFGWGLIVGGLVGAAVMARIGRRRLLVATVIGIGVGAQLFATGRVLAQTLTGAALVGLSGSGIVVAVPGLVADAFGERRTMVFNRINAAPAISGLLFPLSLTVAPSLGLTWRWPTALFPTLLVVIIAVAARPVFRHRVAPLTDGVGSGVQLTDVIGPLKTNKYVCVRFLLQVLQVGLEFSVGVWSVTYLREQGGFSRSMAPLGAAAWAVGMLGSRLLVPRLIALFGRHLEFSCFFGTGLGVMVLLFVSSPVAQLLAISFVAFSAGPMYTLTVERLFLRNTVDTKLTSSLSAVASGLAITLGPLTVGALSDAFGLQRAMLFVPALAIFGMVLCMRRWGNEAGLLGVASAIA
jgi:MFS family permease